MAKARTSANILTIYAVAAILELESLGEGPANFVTLLLCTLIRETLKASPRADEEKVVRHIIFIEEADRKSVV